MNTTVNRQLLTQKTFDSGALGALTSVIHQFPRPGRYQALVRRNGKTIGSFAFVVAEETEAMQLNVDLAIVTTKRRTSDVQDDCHCHEDKPQIVSAKGYVLFFASAGEGYSVAVGDSESGAVEFDSLFLDKGDLFALTLLEPTKYLVTNRESRARGEIENSFSPEDSKRIRNLETIYVNAENSGFEPSQIRLVSTQGLVFRVGEKSRIVIEKIGTADAPKTVAAPAYRWRKQQ